MTVRWPCDTAACRRTFAISAFSARGKQIQYIGELSEQGRRTSLALSNPSSRNRHRIRQASSPLGPTLVRIPALLAILTGR
jgi:hypothetical protein